MRKILALLALPLLLALQACETMPVQLGTAAPMLGFAAAGTLATNPCEAATAAGYTQTINARRTALKLGERGAITVDQAKRVQALADQTRFALDSTCSGAKVDPLMLTIALDRVKELRQTVEALK